MKINQIQGVIPALITPLNVNMDINREGLKKNVGELLACGIRTFMCNGCSGEGIALNREERICVIETILGVLPADGYLIAGAGTALLLPC